ncbi:MAG: LPS export ABC transporter permease LptG [Gammaproteobacteria bacterium]|jgi:lipopolysaccharide export system permease protein|nr:LPS export ABC transporter permease LptG [Gammaproteobacteria bacterium]
MKQLDLYVGRTVAGMILMASAGLIGLFVLFTFLDQMDDLRNDYTINEVARYVMYSVPRIFYETLPFAALIGCLTGLGLLANNSELIVMRSAGVSTWQLFWSATKPALVLIVFGVLVGELLLPDFERTARVLRENAMADDITPRGGVWYRESDIYMHFNSVSHTGELRDIHQYFIDDERQLYRTRWAESANYVPEKYGGYWLLENIVITHLVGETKTEERIEKTLWKTELTPQILNAEILVQPDKMSMMELRRKIRYMESQGLNTGKFELGFWTKLFQPIASLSLVFVAVAFIFGPLRETTMGMRIVTGLIIGILFKFVQDLLSPASLVFGFPPLVATLTPILACVGLGYLLIKRAN